jgi:NAD(P) transhydrogenase subunit alpha
MAQKNIPARVPVSSTWMFANNIYSFVAYLYKDGSLVIDQEDEITGKSLVTRNGQIVHAGALEAINNY